MSGMSVPLHNTYLYAILKLIVSQYDFCNEIFACLLHNKIVISGRL